MPPFEMPHLAMSESPLPEIARDRTDHRPLLAALGVLAVVLVLARTTPPGDLQMGLALAVLIGAPAGARRLGAWAGRVFVLAASFGSWLAFRLWVDGAAADAPVFLLNRLAHFAVPPLLVDLLLADRDRERLGVGDIHLYAPAAAMGLGSAIHLALRWETGLLESQGEIRVAAMFYAACYLVLLVAGLLSRVSTAEEQKAAVHAQAHEHRAIDLEDEGRHGMASRVYEREGQLAWAAQAAERAGEWSRAGRLYAEAGDDFHGGEMYYRAEMWPEALACYERGRHHAAAARLAVQLGDLDRAVAFFEQAGDPAAGVRAREAAGQRPTGEQYRRAGLHVEAARAYHKAGEWEKAADVYEHELKDMEHAAALYMKAKAFLRAARILEALGRTKTALEAYASAPEGTVDAARLCLKLGQTRRAADFLARVSAEELGKIDDEATLALVAQVMVEAGRVDDAIRILQALKRRGEAGGAVHLLLGRALLQKDLPDLGLRELRIAVSLPLDPVEATHATYLLAGVLEQAGEAGEALELYRQLMESDLHYRDVEARYRRLKAAATPAR